MAVDDGFLDGRAARMRDSHGVDAGGEPDGASRFAERSCPDAGRVVYFGFVKVCRGEASHGA